MGGSSTDFLFGEDLETILSLIESPESASMVTLTSSEMQTDKLQSHLYTECSKTFMTSRDFFTANPTHSHSYHCHSYK